VCILPRIRHLCAYTKCERDAPRVWLKPDQSNTFFKRTISETMEPW
jgi:hypothetical protein